MKTSPSSTQQINTERCTVFDILDQDRNGLNNLNLDFITPILLDYANNIL